MCGKPTVAVQVVEQTGSGRVYGYRDMRKVVSAARVYAITRLVTAALRKLRAGGIGVAPICSAQYGVNELCSRASEEKSKVES